ncbi:MAG: type VI secretion system protein TssA [Granulosicoccus sp.]
MEDFESLPEFQALIVAAAGKPERSMGDSVIPAEPPQWGDVRRLAQDLAKNASDQLALHIYLIQAETNVAGFVGFQDSLQALHQLLETSWDSMYPAPDLDDPDDMYYERVNLLHELSDQPAFLESVHRLPLVDVRGIGAFSARDIDICAGTVTGSEEDQTRCQDGLIRGAFAETDVEQLQVLADALAAVCDSCKSIEALFVEKSGQSGALSLQRLFDRVSGCRARFHEYADDYLAVQPEPAAEETQADPEAGTSGTAASQSMPARTSSLSNRSMVRAAFDSILLYYQENEPSSPVRIFAHRAREFVDKSFFDILQELAPAQRDNLPALLEQLERQPMAFLFSDSYYRFLSGETLPTLDPSAVSTAGVEFVAPEPSSDSEPDTELDSEADTEQEIDVSPAASEPAVDQALGNSHMGSVISSREQVLEILQDIETYFVVQEPASPIPLMVGEIRKLVSKRFVELVAEFGRTVPKPPTESSE